MPRPTCRLHPRGRVRRKGFYGARKEFVRWECVPGGGDKPHYLNREQAGALRVKLVGGLEHGCCDGCDRPWEPTDGLVSADYDKFPLRDKARVLVAIARGRSFREAARDLRAEAAERQRGGGKRRASRDGRVAGDWVAQYGDIIAGHHLPERWPHTITLDSFDVRVPVKDARGRPIRKGRHLYSVFAAVGYERGSRTGRLWHIAAFPRADTPTVEAFLGQLAGAPERVVCDDAYALRAAVARAFPKATIIPCAWHLWRGVERHIARGHLDRPTGRLYRALRPKEKDLFVDPERWRAFEATLVRYQAHRALLPAGARDALDAIEKWRARNAGLIAVALDGPGWPRDTKHLEEHLAELGRRLGERRRMLRNLPRLNTLLRLMALDLRGQASESRWAVVLRENHTAHNRKPPPRRLVDGQLIA